MEPAALASSASADAHVRPAGLGSAFLLGAALAIAAIAAYHVLSGPALEAATRLATDLAAQTGVATAVWRAVAIVGVASVVGSGVWVFDTARSRTRLSVRERWAILRGVPTV